MLGFGFNGAGGWNCGVIGSLTVDKYTFKINERGKGNIMIGFSTGTKWNSNGMNYTTNGWFLYANDGKLYGKGLNGRAYTSPIQNGDFISVIRVGSAIRFEKNKTDLGICKAFTHIPDHPLFPAIDIDDFNTSLTLVNGY